MLTHKIRCKYERPKKPRQTPANCFDVNAKEIQSQEYNIAC